MAAGTSSIAAAVVVLLALLVVSNAQTLKLKSYFSDNMVLQRDTEFCVAGNAGSGATAVSVSFDALGIQKNSPVQPDGEFSACFDAIKGGVVTTITANAFANQKQIASLRLQNVIFGDVFICSGQSNMQMSVSAVFNSAQEIGNANYPLIRIFTAILNESTTPLNYAGSMNGWQEVTPKNINGGDWNYFSATCYFFGRDVFLSLGQQVPIGLLTTSYGGTPVESWSTPESFKKCNGTSKLSRFPPTATTNHDQLQLRKLKAPSAPYVLYNAMIHPYLNMRLKGFAWYQGESNAGNPKAYACFFPAMIESWREVFKAPNAPFYFVQLAAYPLSNFAEIRQAQTAALALPNTGMATAIDLGDPKSPIHPIHPRNKQDVGKRLSLWARKFIYSDSTVTSFTGPVLKDKQVSSASGPVATITLTFDSMSTVSQQINFNNTQLCDGCCQSTKEIEVAVQSTTDVTWKQPTSVMISGANVIVLTMNIGAGEKVVGTRYSWVAYAQCAIYNVDKLPAVPFVVNF